MPDEYRSQPPPAEPAPLLCASGTLVPDDGPIEPIGHRAGCNVVTDRVYPLSSSLPTRRNRSPAHLVSAYCAIARLALTAVEVTPSGLRALADALRAVEAARVVVAEALVVAGWPTYDEVVSELERDPTPEPAPERVAEPDEPRCSVPGCGGVYLDEDGLCGGCAHGFYPPDFPEVSDALTGTGGGGGAPAASSAERDPRTDAAWLREAPLPTDYAFVTAHGPVVTTLAGLDTLSRRDADRYEPHPGDPLAVRVRDAHGGW